MTNLPDQRDASRPTVAEQFLLAAHRQRAEALERERDLMLLQSMVRDAIGDVEAAA